MGQGCRAQIHAIQQSNNKHLTQLCKPTQVGVARPGIREDQRVNRCQNSECQQHFCLPTLSGFSMPLLFAKVRTMVKHWQAAWRSVFRCLTHSESLNRLNAVVSQIVLDYGMFSARPGSCDCPGLPQQQPEQPLALPRRCLATYTSDPACCHSL